MKPKYYPKAVAHLQGLMQRATIEAAKRKPAASEGKEVAVEVVL
jgi:hypothetical protein